MLIIPLAALAVSAALSFATVDGLTKCGIPILTAAPSLMASVFIAMSIDYSMFLLTRFQEEKMTLAQYTENGTLFFGPKSATAMKKSVKKQESPNFSKELIPIMAIVLGSSGKIILASGSTLVICFAGLLAIPMNLMQSIGLSCAVSLLYTMIINLTLCPALIYTFPTIFTNSCLPQCGGSGGSGGSSGSSSNEDHSSSSPYGSFGSTQSMTLESVLDGEQEQQYGSPHMLTTSSQNSTPKLPTRLRSASSSVLTADLTHEQQNQLQKTGWYKIALFTQSYIGSCFVILLTALVVIPLGFNAFDGELSATMDAYLPRHGDGLHAISIIENNFAPGTTYPYRLFINVGKDQVHGKSVLNKTFVNAVQFFLTDLIHEKDPKKGALPTGTIMQSYMWSTDLPIDLGGPSIDYFFIDLALKHQLGPRKCFVYCCCSSSSVVPQVLYTKKCIFFCSFSSSQQWVHL